MPPHVEYTRVNPSSNPTPTSSLLRITFSYTTNPRRVSPRLTRVLILPLRTLCSESPYLRPRTPGGLREKPIMPALFESQLVYNTTLLWCHLVFNILGVTWRSHPYTTEAGLTPRLNSSIMQLFCGATSCRIYFFTWLSNPCTEAGALCKKRNRSHTNTRPEQQHTTRTTPQTTTRRTTPPPALNNDRRWQHRSALRERVAREARRQALTIPTPSSSANPLWVYTNSLTNPLL